MDKLNEQQEAQITALMANTFKFAPHVNKEGKITAYKCQYCNKMFFMTYYGIGINERMIQHAKRHGIG